MTTIESSVVINQPIEQVYSFLADFNNHQQLMPEQISNWSSTYDSATFDIKNMGTLALKIQERVANTQIRLLPEGRTPFPLSLIWTLEKTADQLTQANLAIKAELNMMMKMIATGPLQELTKAETSRLKAIFEKG